MNRYEQLNELKRELKQTPVELEFLAQRAVIRAKKSRRKTVLIKTPVISFCSIAIIFVLLVNLFPTVALAMGNVPVLKEFVSAVAFNPSLKAAVENDYYQLVGESQTREDVTVTVDYMIVDAGHISLFFRVKTPVKAGNYFYDFKDASGNPLTAAISSEMMYDTGKLEELKLDFIDGSDIPENFTFHVTINKDENFQESKTAAIMEDDDKSFTTYSEGEARRALPGVNYDFTFQLHPNKQFLNKKDTVIINQWIEIKKQRIYLQSLDIYPTQAKLNIEYDAANSSVINHFNIYFKDEKGNKYSPPKNGLLSSSLTQNTVTLFYESSYFSKADHLTLYIDGIELIDKNKEYGMINYAEKTIENMPDGIRIKAMIMDGDDLKFILKAPTDALNSFYGLISSNYYDKDNNEFHFTSWGTSLSTEGDPYFYTTYKVKGFKENTFKIQWVYAPMQILETPIELEIK